MKLIEVNWHPSRSDLRKFGYICLVAFGGIGTWVFFRHSLFGFDLDAEQSRTLATALWALAAGTLAASLVAPPILQPLYVLLTAISLPIGFVVSHVLMAFLFYVLLTPIGIFFRLTGRDALTRRFDSQAASYWEPRRQADPEQYFRQF